MILEALKLVVASVAGCAGFCLLAFTWGYCSRRGANMADEDSGLVVEETSTERVFP